MQFPFSSFGAFICIGDGEGVAPVAREDVCIALRVRQIDGHDHREELAVTSSKRTEVVPLSTVFGVPPTVTVVVPNRCRYCGPGVLNDHGTGRTIAGRPHVPASMFLGISGTRRAHRAQTTLVFSAVARDD